VVSLSAGVNATVCDGTVLPTHKTEGMKSFM
jgi:hypothetical protein